MSASSLIFKVYNIACICGTAYLIKQAIYEQKNFHDRVVVLTVNKLNLFLLLNCVIALLSSAANFFVYVFFTSIRTLEKKVNLNAQINFLFST
jgi:hypothetical protein